MFKWNSPASCQVKWRSRAALCHKPGVRFLCRPLFHSECTVWIIACNWLVLALRSKDSETGSLSPFIIRKHPSIQLLLLFSVSDISPHHVSKCSVLNLSGQSKWRCTTGTEMAGRKTHICLLTLHIYVIWSHDLMCAFAKPQTQRHITDTSFYLIKHKHSGKMSS